MPMVSPLKKGQNINVIGFISRQNFKQRGLEVDLHAQEITIL